MAKGSYDISVSGDSNLEEEKNNNANRECLNNCLRSTFLRSLSLYDRPHLSQVPTNKKVRKSRYRSLVSSSLEKIPSNSSPPIEARSECRANHTSESVKIDTDIEVTTQPSSSSDVFQDTAYQLAEPDSWSEDRYTRFSVESEKLLEKTVAILRTVSKDISKSFANLTKPESIALESVMEIYKNKGRSTPGCSVSAEFDDHIYENWQPPLLQTSKDMQVHSQQSPMNTLVNSTRQNSVNTLTGSTQQSPKDKLDRSTQQSPKDKLDRSTQQSPKNTMADTSQQSPKNTLADSTQQSPKNTLAHFTQQNLKNTEAHSPEEALNSFDFLSNSNLGNTHSMTKRFSNDVQSSDQHIYENWQPSFQQKPKDLQAHSTPERPKNFEASSTQQSPNNSNVQTLQSQKSLLTPSVQDVNSSSVNTEPISNNVRPAEEDQSNLSSSKKGLPDDAIKVKSPIDFDLPTDHEQFVKIIGALQNRCLEYREMIQDIAFYALEECLNFSQCSIRQMRNLRRQFESQKRNFRDFKELCCKSVVFGSESLPINEKVTEVIQSFYLKLMQEENETFMARLEFGLKMGEVYAKMLKLEKESKKTIMTLKEEILYLKKTSVGFKV